MGSVGATGGVGVGVGGVGSVSVNVASAPVPNALPAVNPLGGELIN